MLANFDPSANPLHKYAYVGRWQKHDEPGYRQWVWTLTNSDAIIFLAFLTILIAFAQTRSWAILRYLILQRNKSVRLDDDDHPEPLERLSQGSAIAEALYLLVQKLASTWRCRRIRIGQHADDIHASSSEYSTVLAWFGLFASTNLVLYVAMGILIPWLLSDGALDPPFIKSRVTDSCLKAEKYENIFNIIGQVPVTDAIFAQCYDQFEKGCDNQYYPRLPQIQYQRIDSCPFATDICYNGTKPFEITHWNITPYEVGINSKSRATLNHKLTCAPVELRHFLVYSEARGIAIATMQHFDWSSTIRESQLWSNLSLALDTFNGPNGRSSNSSGLEAARIGRQLDLHVLPKYFVSDEEVLSNPEMIHPSLRRKDGRSFLIILRPGASSYFNEIDDPFFAAHNKVDASTFVADHEASSLGCFEQYQYCYKHRNDTTYCTDWDRGSNGGYQLLSHIVDVDDNEPFDLDTAGEILVSLTRLPAAFSIFSYLATRIEWHNMAPLSHREFAKDGIMPNMDPQEQWIFEVKVWFRKAILAAIFDVRMAVLFPLKTLDPPLAWLAKEYSLCDRILFRDSDFTNINWTGLCAIISSLVFICLVSYFMKHIHTVCRVIHCTWKDPSKLVLALKHFKIKFWTRLASLKEKVKTILHRVITDVGQMMSALKLRWSSAPHSSRVRRWYGTRREQFFTASNELGDMRRLSSNRDLVFEDIDGVL
jgi:hypothetical protein